MEKLMDQAKKKPGWVVGIVAAVIVLIVVIVMAMPKKLNGSYTAKIPQLFSAPTKDTMKFTRDNKVVEYNDGEKTNSGTYKIDKDKLLITLGEYTFTADLQSDHKSFVITSGSGLASLAKGTRYDKGDK